MGVTGELEDELDNALSLAIDMSDKDEVINILDNYRKNSYRYQRPPKINNAFIKSVINEDFNLVHLLLAVYHADANAEKIDNVKSRAIHIVAASGNTEIAKDIVNHGSLVNIPDGNGKYPIQIAVEHNHIDMVKLLVTEGAAVNRTSSTRVNHEHPLHTSIKNNNWDMFDVLIKKGARLNSTNNKGETCIHYAVRYSQFTLLQKLCDLGTDINLGCPLRYAIMQNSFQMAETLIRCGANLNVLNINGESILNDLPIVYKKDSSRDTELHQFVYKHILEGSKYRINTRDLNDFTPLHHAAMAGSIEMCKLFLEYGANINATTRKGNLTPLQFAVGPGGSAELALHLIEQGARPDILPNKDSGSRRGVRGGENLLNQLVLSSSVEYFDPYQVELLNQLIEKGSAINYHDDHNCTPLERYILLSNASYWAGLRQTTLRNKEVIATFVAAGARLGQTRRIGTLIQQGRSEHHVSPLCRVTWYGDFDTSRFLIDSGVNITKEKWIHFQGRTPEVESYLCELRDHAMVPVRLMFLCRNVIRRGISDSSVDMDVRPGIKLLPVPMFIMSYLMLQEEIGHYLKGDIPERLKVLS